MTRRNAESGNVIWIILVAIVLLGLLTAILSRSGSSVDQSGDFEKLRVRATQVMRYTKSIESAIQQMQTRGISESDISFENPATTTDYTNANCSVDDCKVFSTGGGLTYQDPPSGANDGSEWIFTGANNVGTTAGPAGTTAASTGNDIIMLMPNASTELCLQINRDLGVGTAGTLPVETTGIATTAFTGAYAGGGPTILDGDPAPFELDRQSAGCFTDTAPNPDVTYFYAVILAR
ncbi:MAG TPA: hypothetical protein DEA55_06100 [Rhodospirillaceae bacterium]|nr:hypothetical protein [Rhodospirillaceae bacterium]